jgi:hypothetical protein
VPRGMSRCILLAVVLSAILGGFSPPAFAQLYSGSLTGVVTDASQAVVVGAAVTLTDMAKGFAYTATTDGTGRYTIRALPPTKYSLEVVAAGFAAFRRDNITLDVNQSANIDVVLQVGTTTESVHITAEAPLLSTQDSVTGQELNRTFINDLPLINRAVFDLAYLTPGVTEMAGSTFGSNRSPNNFISNGGRNATADILLDGVTTTNFEQNSGIQVSLYTPSVDAVQEFKVQQSNFSAEIGFTGSTVVNMITRSGSNDIHGSLYEFFRNEKLDANNFFSNRAGVGIPPLRQNQFGGTIGGPIKRDKTFFFFDFEGLRSKSMQSAQAGVPSAAMRQGDFGEICGAGFDPNGYCADPEGQLWDPYSGYYSADEGGVIHTIKIPYNNLATYVSPGSSKLNGTVMQLPIRAGNLIDPVGQKMMNYYPLPNLNVGTPSYDRFNNWVGAGSNTNTNNQFDVKIDHRFNDRNILSSKFAHSWGTYKNANLFGNVADPMTQGPGDGHSYLFSTSFNRTLSPTTLFSLSLGITRQFSFTHGVAGDFPDFDVVKTLGMPEYMNTMGIQATPTIYVYGGYQQVGGNASIGSQAWSYMKYGNETHHLVGSLSKMAGRHDLKFGAEGRMHRLTFIQAGTPDGIFMFDQWTTSEHPWWGGGDGMAGLLIGIPGPDQWGGYEITIATATQSFQYAGYVQDNFRASDKLTVNLGLRYDLNLPRTERYNRMASFNPGATSPLAGQVPGMDLVGAPVFAGQNGAPRDIFNTDFKNFAPRIALAYRLTPKTVLRTGYGIFYGVNKYGASGPLGALGYTMTTNVMTSYQSDGYTPWSRLQNPFPNGLLMPPGNSQGASTNLGFDLSGMAMRQWNKTPYEQTWSFGFQREMPFETVFDVNYIGKKGTHLYFGGAGTLDYLPHSVAMDFLTRPSYYNERVPNPFYGIITDPNSSLSGPDIPRSNLYRDFPQYSYVNAYEPPWSNSTYHALQTRVEKRFSKGLQFLATYVWSKSIDDSSVMGSGTTWLGGSVGGAVGSLTDPFNSRLERSVSEYDIPHVFQLSYVWELPIGRGKALGRDWSPVLNAAIGGWKTAGSWRLASGMPISIGLNSSQSIPTYGGQRPNLLGPLKRAPNWTIDQYFADTSVIQQPEPYAFGTAPRNITSVRQPGTNNASLSLFKEFSLAALREGAKMEFRAEAFNALNHPQFCGPHTTFGQDSLGKITAQCNSPREAQLALKVYF